MQYWRIDCNNITMPCRCWLSRRRPKRREDDSLVMIFWSDCDWALYRSCHILFAKPVSIVRASWRVSGIMKLFCRQGANELQYLGGMWLHLICTCILNRRLITKAERRITVGRHYLLPGRRAGRPAWPKCRAIGDNTERRICTPSSPTVAISSISLSAGMNEISIGGSPQVYIVTGGAGAACIWKRHRPPSYGCRIRP